MTTATVPVTTTETVPFTDERRQAIAEAKTFLLSDENKPYKNIYGTKFRVISAEHFAAYAILRGKDWRKGIHDLTQAKLDECQSPREKPEEFWNKCIIQSGKRMFDDKLISESDWKDLVEASMSKYPAQ